MADFLLLKIFKGTITTFLLKRHFNVIALTKLTVNIGRQLPVDLLGLSALQVTAFIYFFLYWASRRYTYNRGMSRKHYC